MTSSINHLEAKIVTIHPSARRVIEFKEEKKKKRLLFTVSNEFKNDNKNGKLTWPKGEPSKHLGRYRCGPKGASLVHGDESILVGWEIKHPIRCYDNS